MRMNWLTRTFTAEGQRRLALINGVQEWLGRQLLPPAPDRDYSIEFDTENHGRLACLLRTREFEDQGSHWIAMDAPSSYAV